MAVVRTAPSTAAHTLGFRTSKNLNKDRARTGFRVTIASPD